MNILCRIPHWLQDLESTNKILCIFGAPGPGKSTIATTIARELAVTKPFCAKFFAKRDVSHLRDPRQIWRTLAYGLAAKHAGVTAAVMLALSEKNERPVHK